MLAEKRSNFEELASPEKVKEVFDWTTSEEYAKLNFERKTHHHRSSKSVSAIRQCVVWFRFRKYLALCPWFSRDALPILEPTLIAISKNQ